MKEGSFWNLATKELRSFINKYKTEPARGSVYFAPTTILETVENNRLNNQHQK